MELMEAVRGRRSIRSFLDRPVEEEKLQAVLEAGRLAPSARNMQDWRFIVVRDRVTRLGLAQAARSQAFVAPGPGGDSRLWDLGPGHDLRRGAPTSPSQWTT